MHTYRSSSRGGGWLKEQLACKGHTNEHFLTQTLMFQENPPDFKFCACAHVGGELLDEGQEDGLMERTGLLAKHLLRVDGVAHIQHQIEVCCRQSLRERSEACYEKNISRCDVSRSLALTCWKASLSWPCCSNWRTLACWAW